MATSVSGEEKRLKGLYLRSLSLEVSRPRPKEAEMSAKHYILPLTLDARSESLGVAEAEHTSVVDLGFDESGVVLRGQQGSV